MIKMKVRKKPIVVEAIQWTGNNFDEVKELDGCRYNDEHRKIFFMNNNLNIRTLEGDMIAVLGDWIIKGIKGELYPCKEDIFNETYDVVEEETEELKSRCVSYQENEKRYFKVFLEQEIEIGELKKHWRKNDKNRLFRM